MSTLIGLPADFIEQHDLRVSKNDWMFNILKDNTKWAWETYYRAAYTDMAEHKVVIATGITTVDGAETWTVPTGDGANGDTEKTAAMKHLSQGVLDRIYLKLVREGAEPWGMNRHGAYGMKENRSYHPRATCWESSESTLRNP